MRNLNKLNIILILILISVKLNGCVDFSQNNNLNILTVDINGKNDYIKIQNAVNNSNNNGTIIVKSGIYNENIIINKNLKLIGEDKNYTIIDGNNFGDVIYISDSSQVNISGFTIRNSGKGSPNLDAAIDIRSNLNIIKNNIIANSNNGILIFSSNYNNISNNQILNNNEYGIYVHSSSTNNISDNTFISNNLGIRIRGSRESNIMRNIFYMNQKGIDLCCGSVKNIISNNIFSNNTQFNAQDSIDGNYWFYEDIGNYWDDYNFSNNKNYIIKSSGIDNFPIKNVSDISWYEKYYNLINFFIKY